ncbi:hypothetical protein CI102_13673 [Trichoderma harzianum]|nr:hypothetical protein CI102_13673 [Trichoderma harzianum]
MHPLPFRLRLIHSHEMSDPKFISIPPTMPYQKERKEKKKKQEVGTEKRRRREKRKERKRIKKLNTAKGQRQSCIKTIEM